MSESQVIECTRATMPERPLRLAPSSVLCAEAPLTIEDFCDLVDEDTNAELFEGVIIMKSPVSHPHEELLGFLREILGPYVRRRRLGTVLGQCFLVRITDYTGREPDLLFVSSERLDAVKRNYMDGPPDLVIEVVSPSDSATQILQKRVEYEQIGVRELWIIDQPKKRLSVCDLGSDGYFVEREIDGPVLIAKTVPGFRIQVDWLWCEPLEFPDTFSILEELLRQ